MFSFTQASTARAALLAATVALFASHTAFAAQPKEISYWADAQTASRAGQTSDHGVAAQFASQAGDRRDGASAQFASQAGDRKDGANAQLASRATDSRKAVA
jgi:hypothetical protein